MNWNQCKSTIERAKSMLKADLYVLLWYGIVLLTFATTGFIVAMTLTTMNPTWLYLFGVVSGEAILWNQINQLLKREGIV